jgi:hypothetical protein
MVFGAISGSEPTPANETTGALRWTPAAGAKPGDTIVAALASQTHLSQRPATDSERTQKTHLPASILEQVVGTALPMV